MSAISASCPMCGRSYGPEARFCPLDGAPLTAAPAVGRAHDPYLSTTVAGRFQILELIGIGSTGRVYRSSDTELDRDVALKIQHRELLKNPSILARFLREAKLASRLVHPNLVEIQMAGVLPTQDATTGGEAYVVTEYLHGRTLRAALSTFERALPLPRALHIVLQACDAVGEAHSKNVIHRDLKPENVMLVQRGLDPDAVKVLDFGTARLDLSDASVLTQKGAVLGTARYAAPECASGQKSGPPADVYALATLLYECLSGRTPFDGNNPVSVLLQHLREDPAALTSLAQSAYVPSAISQIVHDNLAKTPEMRCPDAREFGRALQAAAHTAGIAV